MNDYYHIITKIESVNGEITYTNIGYVLSENDTNIVNQSYDSTYGAWMFINKSDLENNNIQTSDYFISNPPCFSCFTKTTSIDGFNLSFIEDIQNL
jgi:hypothetical protein